MRPSISGRIITDSSASSEPTADTSSETLMICTGSAFTGNPGLAAAAGGGEAGLPSAGLADVSAGLAESVLGGSVFCAAAVASLFEPQPASSATVTRTARIVTLRVVGVCTASLLEFKVDGPHPAATT